MPLSLRGYGDLVMVPDGRVGMLFKAGQATMVSGPTLTGTSLITKIWSQVRLLKKFQRSICELHFFITNRYRNRTLSCDISVTATGI